MSKLFDSVYVCDEAECSAMHFEKKGKWIAVIRRVGDPGTGSFPEIPAQVTTRSLDTNGCMQGQFKNDPDIEAAILAELVAIEQPVVANV